MYLISIQTTDQKVTELSCDIFKIHDVLNLLETHPKIKAYKIAHADGLLNMSNLQYFYPGYAFPSGKAVDKFNW